MPHLGNWRHAGRPPIAQRPSNPALLRPSAVSAGTKEKKEATELGPFRRGTGYEQPFQPLEPEARHNAPAHEAGAAPGIACPFRTTCELFHNVGNLSAPDALQPYGISHPATSTTAARSVLSNPVYRVLRAD